jgi:hypothetical protein
MLVRQFTNLFPNLTRFTGLEILIILANRCDYINNSSDHKRLRGLTSDELGMSKGIDEPGYSSR